MSRVATIIEKIHIMGVSLLTGSTHYVTYSCKQFQVTDKKYRIVQMEPGPARIIHQVGSFKEAIEVYIENYSS